MPRPRYRLRTLLIAVAVLALALGGWIWAAKMRRLSADYQQRALAHRIKVVDDYDLILRSPDDPRAGALLERRKAYRGAMAEKWNRAALFPWLPVEPDPPPPE